MSVYVDDADAYYREWKSRVTALRAARNEEWGIRTFDLRDPSGNTISIIGPLTDKT